MSDRTGPGSRGASLAGVGATVLLIACCAAGPAIGALAGGIGATALLGASAGVVAFVAFAAATIAFRARRRRSCGLARRR